MITNNPDLYNYMRDRGVLCTYVTQPSLKLNTDELAIIFPNTHDMTVCGNRFNQSKELEYRKECDDIIKWMQCSTRVIIVTPVIKFDSEYMKTVATEQYEKLQQIHYIKQNIHTRDLGSIIVPHRLQLRYIGIDPIDFDVVKNNNFMDPMYHYGYKKQQVHYLNVLNASDDKYTRRKLRYIPEYTLFSQLYKKLKL